MDFTDVIKGRGLLAGLSIHQWTARKLDKKASESTAKAAGADATRGRYHKTLIDPALLKPIATVATEARDYHERNTVPWTYAGVAMLPGKIAMEYTERMAEFELAFDREVSKFLGSYPTAVATAAQALGSMFDIGEYPHASQVRAKFSFGYTLSMLPDVATSDFRVDIPDSVRERVQRDVQAQYAGLVENTVALLVERAKHLHERLSAYSATQGTDERSVFRASTVDGFADTVRLAAAANISDHPGLTAATTVLIAMVGSPEFNADKLRADAKLRGTGIAALSVALGELGVYVP